MGSGDDATVQAVYKLENGRNEYEEFLHALKVAKAKAAEDDEPVTVVKKTLNTYEDVAVAHPDGSDERL